MVDKPLLLSFIFLLSLSLSFSLYTFCCWIEEQFEEVAESQIIEKFLQDLCFILPISFWGFFTILISLKRNGCKYFSLILLSCSVCLTCLIFCSLKSKVFFFFFFFFFFCIYEKSMWSIYFLVGYHSHLFTVCIMCVLVEKGRQLIGNFWIDYLVAYLMICFCVWLNNIFKFEHEFYFADAYQRICLATQFQAFDLMYFGIEFLKWLSNHFDCAFVYCKGVLDVF